MTRSRCPLLPALATAAITALWGSYGDAASPQLSYILPLGIQRGYEHVLTFTGKRLSDTEDVLFYSDGVTAKRIQPVDAKIVRVTVDVAPDCRLGQHLAQLRTRSGISDFRSFFVGALPSVDEKEPNNSFDQPQPLQANVCVAGVLKNEDTDCFRVHVAKGQRLSAEVEGIRLGRVFFDPYLAILDPNHNEIATCDDTVLARQDSFLSIVAPADGDYTILLRDSSYKGSDYCRYRLHVGNFPRPIVVYPAGGKRGEAVKVQFLGDAAGPLEREVSLPADAPADDSLAVEDEHGVTPSDVPFRASADGNVMEAEPNNGFDNATAAEPPSVFNGRLEIEGDVDFFKFSAKKEQVWEIECYAQRIGSPIDPVISVYNAKRKYLTANDDSRQQDSYLRWKVPADGDYYLRVKDQLHRFGPTCVYRVEMTPLTPSLTVTIPRADRFSQTRQTIVVPRGNRYGTVLLATRSDCAGPVELVGSGLPAGVSFTAPPMNPSLNRMPVVFEAAEDAPLDGDLVDLRVKISRDKQLAVEGGFENVADFVHGNPNNAIYASGTVHKLAMAVAEKLPYRLEVVQPKVPLVRRGTMQLKVLVHRDAGFAAPLQLRFPFVPPGVGVTGTVSIAKGATEGKYPLTANYKAAVGKWPVMVIGAANVDGQAWVSSQLAELDVAESYVEFVMKRTACDQGQPAQIQCTLAHNTSFEGAAKAELLGLPPGASAEPLEFTKDTLKLVFQVKTTGKTPLGKHKSLFCRTTIVQNGEPIVGTVGTTELQITAPPAESPPETAQAAAPPPKALSRLEQLRAKYTQAQKSK